jgi:hypothetical protein
MKSLFLSFAILVLSGCSVLGESRVEIVPYKVITRDEDSQIELRHYESMILVSAPMAGDERNSAFRKLFNYISGDNIDESKIAMTAPVFMDQEEDLGREIPMTAPVFMDGEGSDTPFMSFVMPADFTMENTPKPTDPDVVVSEIKDYQVAAIIFNGRLSDSNITKHRDLLEQWIVDEGYVVTGAVKTAGYNAPFTLPAMRRNEVLIPVEQQN